MATIEARHYGETRDRLTKDPIVIDMAHGLAGVPLADLTHADGAPRFEFMTGANDEYRQRGGTDGGHIGAVAQALLMILGGSGGTRYDYQTNDGTGWRTVATGLSFQDTCEQERRCREVHGPHARDIKFRFVER